MAKITIDGKELEVEGKKTIIEAAREHGIDIPHFCWHPGLSISGNCRMCLVEVEKMPKLVISCQTQAAEGMVVHTQSPKVIHAREAVMEFLLINHPLDCPICDEAGDCKLQNYAYKYSTGASRFDEDKVHKPKRVELGPQVMLDVERCIMCSRCIRFTDEIAGVPQLVFTQRGDHVVLSTFPGQQLDNPYSMNVIDLCPVGALTSRNFRFKARVWEMSATESLCPGCSRGCNTNVWVRNNEILRQSPRFNADVNSYWMCDHGRIETLKAVNAETRVRSPQSRKEDRVAENGWDEAIARAASELKAFRKNEIAVIGSAYASNEDNYVLQKFAREVLGTKHIDFRRHEEGKDDALLIRADKTPNSTGAREVGIRPSEGGWDFDGIMKGIRDGHIRALYVVDDNIAADPAIALALEKLDYLVVHAQSENETTRLADAVFPSSAYAEKNGTLTNFQGRVQRLRPAVATIEQDRSLDGFAMSRLDKFGTPFDRWAKGRKIDARPTWRTVAGIASLMGSKFRYATAEDVFNEIASNVESFRGMSFRKLGTKGMLLAKKEKAAVGV